LSLFNKNTVRKLSFIQLMLPFWQFVFKDTMKLGVFFKGMMKKDWSLYEITGFWEAEHWMGQKEKPA